jgi:hypothetical protein
MLHRSWLEIRGQFLRWTLVCCWTSYGQECVLRRTLLPLVDALTSLSESLIQSATVLDEDQNCLMRAFDRVKQKQRPSHKKEIKDSVHLEHYQELARQLNAAAFAQPVIFVSTNGADFWPDTNTPQYPHVDLRAELKTVALIFYGRLEYALRHLQIIPGNPPPPLP